MSAPAVHSQRSLRARIRGNAFVRQFLVAGYIATIALRLFGIRLSCGKRLLVIFRAGGLGDIIATLPAVAALRAQYPERHIVYCTRPDFCGISALVPAIDRVIGIYNGDAVALALASFVDARRFRYPDEYPSAGSTDHFVQEMAASVGTATPADAEPRIEVEPMSDSEFAALFPVPPGSRRIVALHLGPTAPVKEWPTTHWRELASSLQKTADVLVVQIGSGSHFLHGSRDVSLPGAVSPKRALTLLESARLLRRSELMIGVDSGPLHLAAAVGARCIGLFGPVDPRLRAPTSSMALHAVPRLSCQFCHHAIPRGHWDTGCPHDFACMTSLTPAQTIASVAKCFDPADTTSQT